MALYKIQKRNGTIVTFDRLRIENALAKAIEAVGGDDFTEVAPMADEIVDLLEFRLISTIPHVEQVQDTVEEVLIKK
jgi:ribonucleoside-triphosphate reductase